MKVVLLVAIHLCLFLGSAAAANWILQSRSGPVPQGLSLGKPRLVTPPPPGEEPDVVEPAAVKPGAKKSRRLARRSTRKRKPRPGPSGTRPATLPPSAPVTEPSKTETPTAPPVAPASPAKQEPGTTAPMTKAPAKTQPAPPTAADAGRPPAAPDPTMGSAEKFRVSLNVGSVQMVVRHHLPQLRLCYGRNVKGDAVRGVVEIRFTVNEQGKVGSASVHRGHQAVGRCIVGKLKTWRFPRPVGGEMTFIYPFVISG